MLPKAMRMRISRVCDWGRGFFESAGVFLSYELSRNFLKFFDARIGIYQFIAYTFILVTTDFSKEN